MKDLDRTQVYDLTGITEEQAKELYEWLLVHDEGWDAFGYRRLIECFSLEYSYPEWMHSGSNPTTHISTLFEKPYEQQLQEAKKKLEHYKREVERLKNERNPKIGDVVKFYDDDSGTFVIGELEFIYYNDEGESYEDKFFTSYKNAQKLTEQEVIDLLFKKQ